MADGLTRRGFIQAAGAALTVPALAAACAPGTSPVSVPQAQSGSRAREPWEDEWDKLVAAAQAEGTVSVVTNPGAGFRDALAKFEDTFGIKVDQQASGSASLLIPKVQQERAAGIYSLDVAVFTIQSLMSILRPTGALDPIRPALIRGDVIGDQNWKWGFEFGFADNEKRWVYDNVVQSEGGLWVHTDRVPDGSLKSVQDLLDPKWKGKILSTDVRAGGGYVPLTAIRIKLGDDFLRRLLIDQQITFRRDRAEVAREMARGTYPIAFGMNRAVLQEFIEQGVSTDLKPIKLPELVYNTGNGVWLFNKAPHPNAAKVLANWSLTKEGQEIWTNAYQYNSIRADVALFDAENPPMKDAPWFSNEDLIPVQNDTRDFLEQMLR